MGQLCAGLIVLVVGFYVLKWAATFVSENLGLVMWIFAGLALLAVSPAAFAGILVLLVVGAILKAVLSLIVEENAGCAVVLGGGLMLALLAVYPVALVVIVVVYFGYRIVTWTVSGYTTGYHPGEHFVSGHQRTSVLGNVHWVTEHMRSNPVAHYVEEHPALRIVTLPVQVVVIVITVGVSGVLMVVGGLFSIALLPFSWRD